MSLICSSVLCGLYSAQFVALTLLYVLFFTFDVNIVSNNVFIPCARHNSVNALCLPRMFMFISKSMFWLTISRFDFRSLHVLQVQIYDDSGYEICFSFYFYDCITMISEYFPPHKQVYYCSSLFIRFTSTYAMDFCVRASGVCECKRIMCEMCQNVE